MAFEDGDFLEIEFSEWNASDNRLVSTTDESKAKEAGIYSKDASYGPALVVLGSSGAIKGLDRELRGMSAGETKKFTFAPADAFGERDEGLVRVMPLSAFRAREIEPYVGLRVDIDGTSAIVKSVNSGRVVVDGNHPYAGKSIVYEVRIARNITDDKEKIDALGRSYGAEPTGTEVKGGMAEMSFDDSVRKDTDYFINKAGVIASVFANLKGIDRVVVREEYARPKDVAEKK